VQHELVDRAKRGDGEAFDALARTVGDKCMAIACRILRDLADPLRTGPCPDVQVG
jgi:hypothetical protein